MWKDSIRNIVVIFQTTILRIVGFCVRHSAINFCQSKKIAQPLQRRKSQLFKLFKNIQTTPGCICILSGSTPSFINSYLSTYSKRHISRNNIYLKNKMGVVDFKKSQGLRHTSSETLRIHVRL